MSTRSQYWEWSKPSLVLAFVSSLFALLSVYAQGGIQGYYRSIVAATLGKVAANDSVTPKEIQRAELAVKRLLQGERNVGELQMNAANLANGAAIMHASRARAFRQEGDVQRAVQETAQRQAAARRTFDAMSRLSKEGGELGARARLWLVAEGVPGGPLAEVDWGDFWNRIQTQLPLSDSDTDLDREVLLSALQLRGLCRLSTAVQLHGERGDRRRDVETAVQEVEMAAEQDPRCYMIYLEGIECMVPGSGVAVARTRFKGLLDGAKNLAEIDGQHRELERIDAAFVSLLVLDSTDEAVAFAMSNLEATSLIDHETLQAVLTQSLMRAIGRAYWFCGDDADANAKRLGGLIKGLFLLGSKYPKVLQLLDRVVFTTEEDRIAVDLSKAITADHESEVSTGIRWLRERCDLGTQGDLETPITSLEGVGDELALPILGYLGYLIREQRCRPEVAFVAIGDLIERWPTIGELKIAQAMVALELSRVDKAIEILSELNENIPNNAQIQNLLLQAYERALSN